MEPGVNVLVSLAFRVYAAIRRGLFAEVWMSVARARARLKTFHATMVVTRREEWCVDAQTPAEAKALLAAGQGHRCHLGDCLHMELEAMELEAVELEAVELEAVELEAVDDA
jgi:hypothetical protein